MPVHHEIPKPCPTRLPENATLEWVEVDAPSHHVAQNAVYLCKKAPSTIPCLIIQVVNRNPELVIPGISYMRSERSPATLALAELRPLLLNPSLGASKSWTATLGTCGTGSFLLPSGLLIMSVNERPWLRVVVGVPCGWACW